ncbi:hypothetical protein [Shewanella sp. CG12_big_fil_rev_8_21_14_0_65_47_15]|uniref:hypothetical protein n=1 Tax=Shewanella sp. CG12_big_fil_rev_8_21_14_0_65_47_15 TaxID=1975537 RepID=UPI000CCB7AD8|nr:hypothetical protein [Shewanella sp. CG12_big_fil_rev_8_21_14_0_65_47_15]PIW63141.1 MAG: hypothetical protein COW15_01190 [Shewanella sp. CG12_big_fil_rev_8_21_14_0_65_47_15]
MFKNTTKCFAILSVLLLSGCAQILTAEQSAPEINFSTTEKPLTIAVIDKREYVVNNDKTPAFEGLIRSGFGIPYSYNTPTNEAMSVYLTNRLLAGFSKRGIKAESVETSPNMSIDSAVTQVSKNGSKSIIFVLNEWKYDYHALSDNSWYNLDLMIIDENGNEKLVKNFTGENDIPGGAIVNEMQLIYKQRFEAIFKDAEVIQALSL